MRKIREYSKAFIQDAVQLALNTGKPQSKIAKELDVPVSTLRQWIQKAQKDGKGAFDNVRELTPEQEELSRLRKKLSDVTMERDILKKAVGIFSKTQN